MRWAGLVLLIVLSVGCASYDRQIQAITQESLDASQTRREALDQMWAMALSVASKQNKLIAKIPQLNGAEAIEIYNQQSELVYIVQMLDKMVTQRDMLKFPEHPMVGFMREVKDMLKVPGAIITGALAGKWILEAATDNAGHNTYVSGGGDASIGDMSKPVTETTTETITTVETNIDESSTFTEQANNPSLRIKQ